jgi:two-component system, chemotaxis family, chemotaxis protein CheY
MGYHILIVDDNRIMRDMVARAVQMSPLEIGGIHQAADGAQALTLLQKTWIDLILLDINMPVMNGEQFLQALRADPALKSQQVIVVSTESSKARIDRLRALGAGFIHKPFRPEELIRAVDAITNQEAP